MRARASFSDKLESQLIEYRFIAKFASIKVDTSSSYNIGNFINS